MKCLEETRRDCKELCENRGEAKGNRTTKNANYAWAGFWFQFIPQFEKVMVAKPVVELQI